MIRGEKLVFANQRAVFWEREKMLIISDIHVGKTAHFRKNGIPVPSGILDDDLENLSRLITCFKPRKLMIVGDLLHAGYNSDLDIFCAWREKFPRLELILIKGNHDRIEQEILDKMCIGTVKTEFSAGPFTFKHEPENIPAQFVISGHIHPGVVLSEGKIQNIRLACFAYSDTQLILPAFSKFTGLDYKSLNENFIKIAVHKDFIFEV